MASNEPPKINSTFDESSLECHKLVGHGAWKSKKYGNIEVAAKKMPILPSDDIGEKFGSEINYLQTLEHENIITYYGHAVTKENLVIITEYAPNGSLHDYLKRTRRLPPELKVEWAIQIAKGIKYLQDKKILHRDVKSGNILITGQNNLKICDFGVAKDLSNTTTTSNAKGTYKWLAPEVYTDQKLSPSADIFAFGVVLWELETCETPYKDLKRPERVIWEVGSKGLRPEIPKTCPRVLKKLMKRCWDKDRRKRPDANEIIYILESYQSGLQWHHKHTIQADVSACHWISHQQLAVCLKGGVKVYEVTTESSHLAYTLTNQDWEGKFTRGVAVTGAVSESSPDDMFVICDHQPYVYQHPCHQAKEMIKKYKITDKNQDDGVNLQCIVANAI
ncbi:mitogen-activated protein kinase kinase kinase 13-B-like [Amphiura filiformis]|uniref:mitogen-activated protein kinase kinase kinase 13-B-like n=1 Tax=Amphiura filiformis TaxID=82378 RepID=UPI003B21CB33